MQKAISMLYTAARYINAEFRPSLHIFAVTRHYSTCGSD